MEIYKVLVTIGLLLCSNVVMTIAWYGNLKLKEMNMVENWPLWLIIICSWGVALVEYCFLIPANRIGSNINGGPFSLMQLKIMQECISLVVFTIMATLLFNGESLQWNHVAAFVCIVAAVFFAFLKN